MNRRQRKRIEMAKNIIVHAFAGEDQARWKAMETQDTVVLAVLGFEEWDESPQSSRVWLVGFHPGHRESADVGCGPTLQNGIGGHSVVA